MKKSILSLFVLVNLALADFIRDESKEIVIDTTTNLMWQDDSNASSLQTNWSDAIAYCENLTLGGYDDWYLPNFNELFMLADRSIYDPALSPVFKNVSSSVYWSATTSANDNSYAWAVGFSSGYDNDDDKTNSYYVRCVRLAD